MDLNRRTVLKGGAVAGAGGLVGSEFLRGADAHVSRSSDWGDQNEYEAYDDYEVHIVSKRERGFDTIQQAVNAASEQDLVLIERGVYHEKVENHNTPKLTIRGVDRNEVVIDGEFERANGVISTAHDVVVENLTARNHTGNGVYWTGVEGFRGSYLTAYNNQEYGIYAFDSRYGRFEHCYASGHDDAGFYIGESQPASAVITDCVAEHNAMGYSGTNAGGNFVIKNSEWRNNMTGIVPNTLDSQEGAPQGHIDGGIRIENNEIHHNNNMNAPAYPVAHPVAGNGITVAGGTRNDIVDNYIHHQQGYGIVIGPIFDDSFYRPKYNAVMNNRVEHSGRADIVLAAPAKGNAFADNEYDNTRPVFLEQRDGSFGDLWIMLKMFKDFQQAEMTDSWPRGEVGGLPVPDARPNMENPVDTPPMEPIGEGSYE